MATLFYMQFNKTQGALVADESTWHLGFKYGYRRSNYGDGVASLLTLEQEKKTGRALLYGGVGFPSFHYEVVQKSKKMVSQEIETLKSNEQALNLVYQNYQNVHHRYINDRLRFLFGMTQQELLEHRAGDTPIKQELVIEEGKKLIKPNESYPAPRIFENEGILTSFNAEEGLEAYNLYYNATHLGGAVPLQVLGCGGFVAHHFFF